MNDLHYEEDYDPQEHTWDDWSEEEEEQQVQCLYCKDILPSAKEVLQHMKSAHTFDFQNTRKTLQLDFYQCIRLINYVRYKVQEDASYSCTTFDKNDSFFKDDKYLQPVLENDPLLFAFEDSEEEEEEEEEAIDLNKVEPTTELEKKLLSLLFKAKEDLNNLQGQFEDYKSTGPLPTHTQQQEQREEKAPWRERLAFEVAEVVSVIICVVFLLEIILSLIAFGPKYYLPGWPHWKLHVFDATVVITTFILEFILKGKEREVAGLLIVFRLWRIVKVIEAVILSISYTHEEELDRLKESYAKLEDKLKIEQQKNTELQQQLQQQ
ncbi:hypothetical protein G6F31_003528 [Rhizopus arrhizus]|nr:hypothetical protein G6F31_003528 [Rhizopus arrhizus]